MFRFVLPIVFVAASAISAAAENWYGGYIVLKNKKTLRGELAIQYEHDVVLFRIGSDVTVFPAFKVESFSIYDGSVNAQKEFITVESTNGITTNHRFFERVVAGDYQVLRRQQTTWYSVHLDILEYDYYVSGRDGTLLPIERFKKNVYPDLLASTDGALKRYVKTNHLSPTRVLDTILIVRHYNYLQAGAQSLARN